MTTQTAAEESYKAPIAWTAVAVVVAGYLWGLLSEHGLALWGLVAFLVATVVLVLGLRRPPAVARVAGIVVFVVLLVGSITAALLLS